MGGGGGGPGTRNTITLCDEVAHFLLRQCNSAERAYGVLYLEIDLWQNGLSPSKECRSVYQPFI